MALAMVFSLVLATVIFVPTIALVGISESGTQLFGDSTLMDSANATMWNAASSYDLLVVVPFVVIGGISVVGLLFALRKYITPQGQDNP